MINNPHDRGLSNQEFKEKSVSARRARYPDKKEIKISEFVMARAPSPAQLLIWGINLPHSFDISSQVAGRSPRVCGRHGRLYTKLVTRHQRARTQLPINAIAASASGKAPAQIGNTCCIPAAINSVASTPAVPALRTRRMESSRSASSPPTTQSRGGSPAKSANTGEARG